MLKVIFSIGIIVSFLTVFAYLTGWSSIHDIPIFENNDSPSTVINTSSHSPVINESKSEKIMIRAIGIGFAKDSILNSTRRREMAKRAAEAIAYNKLAKRIRGATVESISKTKDQEYVEETVEIKVIASLKSQRTINTKENTDGSVEVTVEAPLIQ